MIRHPAIAATVLGLGLGATQAQAAKNACLTVPEAEALIGQMLPTTLEAVGARCAASLPDSAILRAGLPSLVARYRAEVAGSVATARAGATKLVGDAADSISPETITTMLTEIVGKEITKDIKSKDCGTIDRAIGLLAPMPATNVAGLIVLALQSTGGKQMKDLPICPVTPS